MSLISMSMTTDEIINVLHHCLSLQSWGSGHSQETVLPCLELQSFHSSATTSLWWMCSRRNSQDAHLYMLTAFASLTRPLRNSKALNGPKEGWWCEQARASKHSGCLQMPEAMLEICASMNWHRSIPSTTWVVQNLHSQEQEINTMCIHRCAGGSARPLETLAKVRHIYVCLYKHEVLRIPVQTMTREKHWRLGRFSWPMIRHKRTTRIRTSQLPNARWRARVMCFASALLARVRQCPFRQIAPTTYCLRADRYSPTDTWPTPGTAFTGWTGSSVRASSQRLLTSLSDQAASCC